MAFGKLVFPIDSNLKSFWDTDENASIFDGNNLSIPILPQELSYEYLPSEITKGVVSYHQSYPYSTDPIRMILTLNEGRIAIYYILAQLYRDSLDNKTTISCIDYCVPNLADALQGYSERQLICSLVTVKDGSVIIDDNDVRYFQGIQADFTIYSQ